PMWRGARLSTGATTGARVRPARLVATRPSWPQALPSRMHSPSACCSRMSAVPRALCTRSARGRSAESDHSRHSLSEEVDEGAYCGQQSAAARKHRMHHALGAVPVWQHASECSAAHILAHDAVGQLCNSEAGQHRSAQHDEVMTDDPRGMLGAYALPIAA